MAPSVGKIGKRFGRSHSRPNNRYFSRPGSFFCNLNLKNKRVEIVKIMTAREPEIKKRTDDQQTVKLSISMHPLTIPPSNTMVDI
jgi:hypothetical protein